MKRYIKQHMTIKFEIDIDIITDQFDNIVASSDVDLTDTAYDDFIFGMITSFRRKNYGLMRDEEYTHPSNFPGSLSEYYTFTKWIDDVQVIVVVSVRVSDHPDKANLKRGWSAESKRSHYAAKISNEIADKFEAEHALPYTLDIVFDDEHFHSYSSAEFKIQDRINQIEDDVAQIIEENCK